MKLTSAFVLVLLFAPLASAADKPSTRPFFPRQEFGRAARLKATQPEIDETLAFVKDNFKNHYDLFSRITPGTPFYNMAVNKMVNRYRQLMRMKDQNPDIYDAMLKQAKSEDNALGFAKNLADKLPDADVRLREAVRVMVDQGLDERRQRIQKLRELLDEQEKKLKEDEDNRDQTIASQIDRIKEEYRRMVQGPRGTGAGDQPDVSPGKEIDASQK